MDFKTLVRDIPDFPKPGVMFRDISPLLEDHRAFTLALDKMIVTLEMGQVDHVVGIESRGFILGAALAARFAKGFIPLRKAGKLPPPVEAMSYKLEYGEATLEMRRGRGRVVVIDDVLATGGTLDAGIKICDKAGYEVVGAAVLIDLRFLNQFKFNGARVGSVIQYE
ncbi:MAG: adenine phosphoribosyltransferase [Bdellovibrionota bacterium]